MTGSPVSPFQFITITDLQQINDTLMQDLLQEKITGVLIKEFLNSEEVASALNGVFKQNVAEKTKINEGFYSFPITFAQFTQLQEAGQLTLDQYCAIAQELLQKQADTFGTDIVGKIQDLLQRFSSFQKVSPIINKQTGQPLVPFTIRELLPGKGELIIHCENLFFDEFPRFFELLQQLDIKDNKLSYFITLSEAEQGGELCCFDLNWSRVKKRVADELLEDEYQQSIDIVNDPKVQRMFIKPAAGDLLLFAGGNVWHRVEKVLGNKPRVTLGGFIAETTSPGKYYIWS
jgi:hypothetical protein